MAERTLLNPSQAKEVEEQLFSTLRQQVGRSVPMPLPRSDFWKKVGELLDPIEMELHSAHKTVGNSLKMQTLQKRQANVRRTATELARKRMVAMMQHSASMALRTEGGGQGQDLAAMDWSRHDPAEREFYSTFKGKYSKGFDLKKDLEKIGVVNQTTMLASETEEISNFLKQFIINKKGQDNYKDYFADTRDTLCYATNENQKATYGLLEVPADLAIVVGGYNSSNTSHLVELCEKVLPTYFVKSEEEILSKETIRHFNYNNKTTSETDGFLPNKEKLKVIINFEDKDYVLEL